MAIRSLKTGQFSRSALVGNPVIMPGSYESIATVTVGSGGAANVEFTSIPATYTHLQIRGIARTGSDQAVLVTFNGSSSTYKNHYLEGTGTSAIAGAETNSGIALYAVSVSTANTFSGFVWDILDYANTNKNKVLRALNGFDKNGTGYIDLDSGLWVDTSAITSIKVTPTGSTTFQQYSHFALYGVN
jgi:hypothetical protein